MKLLHSHTSVFFFLFFVIINLHFLPLQATTTTHTSTSDTTNNNKSAYYKMYTGHVYASVAIAMVILVVAFFAAGCLAVYLGGCTDAAVASSNSSRLPLLLPVTILPRGSSSTTTSTTTHLRLAGLDASTINSLPTFPYSDVKQLKIGKASLECAVCLSEFRDEETLKLLPKCDHVFHPGCIDPWLAARPTCPVCRADLLATGDDNNKNDGSVSFANLVVDEPDTPSSSSAASDGGVFRKHDNRQCGKRVLKIVIVEIPTSDVEEQSGGSESERDAEHRRTVGEEERQEEEERGGGGMLWRFTRSRSTGINNDNNNDNSERFRLTLPEDVRREVLVRSEHLQRSKSFAALPKVSSPRSGYRSSRI